ncbi:MAG TPA: SDR family oxidoreductase [Aggregatilineales bacterium]|nr:SDR family oxidoreductase [Aggregatilineales bacterium]
MTTIDLKGKVALVTGSARRVGKAIALELARQGMHQVIHHSKSQSEAQETVRQAEALGVQAVALKADLTQADEVQRLFEDVEQRFQRLDVLVNSASTFTSGSFAEMLLADWQATLDINLTAPFLCSQHAAHLMGDSGGSIINILDLSALQPWKSYPAHTVSKAALKALTEVMALSLAPGIRVNAIVPGPVLRDDSNSPEQWEKIGMWLPLGHTGDPADVAQAVVFLASQPFLTGTILRVDGGDYLR